MHVNTFLASTLLAVMGTLLSAQEVTPNVPLKTLSDVLSGQQGNLLSIPSNAVVLNATAPASPGSGATAATTYNWIKSADLPSQYQKAFWVKMQLTPTAVPTAGTISNVFWQWSLGSYVSGQVVYLCYNDCYDCLDISPIGSGNTSGFNTRSANHSFWYYLYVSGSGMLNPPVIGGSGSVMVSDTY